MHQDFLNPKCTRTFEPFTHQDFPSRDVEDGALVADGARDEGRSIGGPTQVLDILTLWGHGSESWSESER